MRVALGGAKDLLAGAVEGGLTRNAVADLASLAGRIERHHGRHEVPVDVQAQVLEAVFVGGDAAQGQLRAVRHR